MFETSFKSIRPLLFVIILVACNLKCAQVSSYAECHDRFVELVPITGVTGMSKWTKDPSLIADTAFANRMILVLTYYGIPAFKDPTARQMKVMVAPETVSDDEFIFNLTKKANDPEWLRTHVGPVGL